MALRYSAKSRLPWIDVVISLVRPSRIRIVPVAPAFSSNAFANPSRCASALVARVVASLVKSNTTRFTRPEYARSSCDQTLFVIMQTGHHWAWSFTTKGRLVSLASAEEIAGGLGVGFWT